MCSMEYQCLSFRAFVAGAADVQRAPGLPDPVVPRQPGLQTRTYCALCEEHLKNKFQQQAWAGRVRSEEARIRKAAKAAAKVGRFADAVAGFQVPGSRLRGRAPGQTARRGCRLHADRGRRRSLPLAACILQPILAVCPGALLCDLLPGTSKPATASAKRPTLRWGPSCTWHT